MNQNRTYIIAEIGPNHNGSIDTALKLVKKLSEIDIDAIKFQLAIPENVYSADAFKADYQIERDGTDSVINMSKRLQLSISDHKKLYKACRENNVDYLCSAFDLESLKLLNSSFNLRYFKIPSGEIHSIDMLSYISKQKKPILLSTGMATFKDISKSLEILDSNNHDITLLHCVSVYPASLDMINLSVIPRLFDKFGCPVGYSDHTIGNESSLGAVALGASVIEKHVTLDKCSIGPDHEASATIEEMAVLVREIRNLEAAIGKPIKEFSKSELSIRSMARKSIIASHDIPIGTVLSSKDFCFKRPGSGISPLKAKNIIGLKTHKKILYNNLILEEHLERTDE